MKRYILALLAFGLLSTARAQLYVASGETVSVTAADGLVLLDDLVNNGTIERLTLSGTAAQTMSGTGTINHLKMDKSSGTATVSASSGMMNVTGTLTPTAGILATNGKLTLKSDAFGTARVAAGSASGGYVTGNVTVERYIPAGRKWRFLCAPLIGSTNNSVFYNWQNNDVPNGNTGVEIWGPAGDTDPSSSNSGLAVGAGASMRSYGSSGWQNVTNTNSTYLFDATTNNGFALFLTGPYNNGSTAYIGTSGSLPTGVSTTLSATGSLITGDHTKNFTVSSAGQYFLVANPYASPVDPASFTATGTVNRTNLDNILYMWDAKQGGSKGLGRYVSFDIDGNTYSVEGGTGTGYPAGTLIQSGQAFFVRATATGQPTTRLIFRESAKGSASSHTMMGSSIQTGLSSIRIQLEQDSVTLDGAVSFFHAGASASVDAQDGVKLLNSTDNLGLRRDGQTLVFEHRPLPALNDTLQLRLGQMGLSSYRLRIQPGGWDPTSGIKARLIDRHTRQERELELAGVTEYPFQVVPDTLSTGDRFLIVFTKAASNGGGTAEPAEAGRANPYPNPVVSGVPVRVDIDGTKAPWSLRLMDAAGRTVWQQTVKDPGQRRVDIDMSRMATGVFQLFMTDGKGTQSVSRLLKQ